MPRLSSVVAMLVCCLTLLAAPAGPAKEATAASARPGAAAKGTTASAGADSPSDSVLVSVLTCSPGGEVYELCGHSAIRIRRISPQGELLCDSIWNYGIFDFSQPNFVYRFVSGQTDYMLGAEPFLRFLGQYYERGSSVTEQDLAFTQEEARALHDYLRVGSLPENRVYRYNYVKENCATSIRDALDATATSRIIYPDSVAYGTFRREMRAWHANYPWYQFGIDLALGSGLDYRLRPDEEMFVPVVMMHRMAGARMADGRPLVSDARLLFPATGDAVLPPTPWYLTPLFWSVVVFLIALVTSIVDVRRGRITLPVYVVWFLVCGVAGLVIAFLVFVSTHEATSPNRLIFWLNPLALIVPLFIWWRRTRPVVFAEMLVTMVCTGVLLIAWPWQSQSANPAFFPLMATSVMLAAAYSLVYVRTGNVSLRDTRRAPTKGGGRGTAKRPGRGKTRKKKK